MTSTPIISGTQYFPSLTLAVRYYAPYGYTEKCVKIKIMAGEIKIGKPFLKAGQKVILRDSCYWVETP